jgi:hypothetical protein
MVVAREAIVITVGARPIKYGEITVRHNRTDEIVTIPNQNEIVDEGDEGIPYAFKMNQRVRNDHPAVKANPGAFIPADEVDADDQQPAA